MADFPTTIPDLNAVTYQNSTPSKDTHPNLHNSVNNEIDAIATKIGTDNSADTTSIDYKLKNSSSSNPGHKHTLAHGATDVTASKDELNTLDGFTGSASDLNYAKDLNATGVPSSSYTSITDGWIASGETWTYSTADSPTYTFTISGDKTSKYSPGMRIRLTQTTIRYFIVTGVNYSAPNTTVTIYGGTDYALDSATITSPYFSMFKAPVGFPLDPTKWTVTGTVAGGSQASPTNGTIYNLGGNIVVPIGVWKIMYTNVGYATRASTGLATMSIGLGTATNSFAIGIMYSLGNYPVNPNSTPRTTFAWESRVPLVLASKTTYYLNARVNATAHDPLVIDNTSADTGIWAVCLYL